MGRAAVRSAIVNFIGNGAVPGLTTVYKTTPYIIPGDQFFAPTGTGTPTGAIAAVHFSRSRESRMTMGTAAGSAFPGSGAQKMVTHHVELYIRVHSRQTKAEAAMDDADAIYDALLALLRSPKGLVLGTRPLPGLSTPGIFLAGEDEAGDLELTSDAMHSDRENSIWQYSNLQFTVKEIVLS